LTRWLLPFLARRTVVVECIAAVLGNVRDAARAGREVVVNGSFFSMLI
jgi:hypothetical protein